MRSVVTGGSGFLGRHLIRKLIHNESHVVVFDLREYQHDDDTTAHFITVRTGTITQLGDLVSACRNVDVVYHCVSADPLDSQNEALMWSINVEGTKNVIEACKQCCVPKLIFLSSASVVFDGKHMLNADETRPYPTKYVDFYSKSKAEAEKLVLAANRESLSTCALRPSAIFGEHDPMFVPRLVQAGREGKTKYIIGDGRTKWEFTYVGNVADACVKAAEHLSPSSPVAGQAYFITNNETTLFWEQCGVILGNLGYPVPSVCIPIFTTHRQLSCAKAKRDFGYTPKVSMEEGMQRTLEFFKPLANNAKPTKTE